MGKEVEHHEAHHTEHSHKHEPSKLSSFKHRMADMFKELVEPPPKQEKEMEAPEKEYVEHGIRITAETADSPVKEIEETSKEIESEEVDEDDLRLQEREKTREMIHEHIVGKLNSAVAQWKETGNIGVSLEPPVPLKDKVKSVWSHIKEKSAPLAAKLKQEIELVAEKVSSRLKRAEQKGEKLNADVVVKDEWQQVLKKLDSMAGPSERDEIEKIYKQLGGE